MRRHLLIAGRRGLWLGGRWRRLLVSLSEQTAQKARGVRGLRALLLNLLQLLLKLAHLGLRLIERDVLHEHRLRKHVESVRISGETLVQQSLGIRIFFLQRSLVQAIDEGVEKLFFLGSHESSLRRSFSVRAVRLS